MSLPQLKRVTLNDENDVGIWKWSKTKKFIVKSVYEFLTSDEIGNSFSRVKAKIPEKIKIFMWLVEKKAILTKDNMPRTKWQGDPGCFF
jgi:hypothetical protein